MIQTNYNPDVLSCLANLSNDEVFTPPSLVNDILDLLPAELWSNPNAKFLDPVSKSGVFLREMAKRLMKGLETQIPDKQERINHIFSQQLYGIAITDLTALLSRRSVYCSKTANGKYSICETFDDEQGNIRYQRMKHTWKSGKCSYCGASQEVYDREDTLETYAYHFIHTSVAEPAEANLEKIYNMKFDVIVGNPPYQLNDGGGMGQSAIPLYQKFVEQAKKLSPKYLSMIIPARWYSGGKGLDDFRKEMLHDRSLRIIVDFPNAIDCFPGVEIKGGVCYFLWDRDNKGDCKVITSKKNQVESSLLRPLLEEGTETFIRYNDAISIFRNVHKKKETKFNSVVSNRNPFGFLANFKKYKNEPFNNSFKIYVRGGFGYIDNSQVTSNRELISAHKIFISKAYNAGDNYPHQIINVPFYGEPNSICTETYLVIGAFTSRVEAENVLSYMQSKLFRLLVLLKKISQNTTSSTYQFVPLQNFSEPWTDEKLYAKYGLTEEEIAFIDSMIRPMDLSQNAELDE